MYPIVHTQREWFLDKGRAHLQLRIVRRQLPLTPAFGITAHAAQGQTLNNGAIIDLCIGGSSSTMSNYVALTRVERRADLLILKPFHLELFCQGQKPGMELSLRTWRGDTSIDWDTAEKELMLSKCCPTCGFVKFKSSHSSTVFKRVDDNNQRIGSYKLCLAKQKADGFPL